MYTGPCNFRLEFWSVLIVSPSFLPVYSTALSLLAGYLSAPDTEAGVYTYVLLSQYAVQIQNMHNEILFSTLLRETSKN